MSYTCFSQLTDGRLRKILLAVGHSTHRVRDTMMRDLHQGITLVLDRYVYSGIAFSTVKGLTTEWCKAPDVGLPAPDTIIYLDLAEEAAAKRGGFGEERYERAEIQKKVRNAFTSLHDRRWTTIDASGTVDEVQAIIWQTLEPILASPTPPLSYIL